MVRSACVLMALLAGPVSAQTLDKPTVLLEAAANTLALMELTASEACIQQGACRETNPVMPGGTGPGDTATRALIKGSGQAASTWLIVRLSRRHPRWARVASVGKVALNGWLAARALDYQR